MQAELLLLLYLGSVRLLCVRHYLLRYAGIFSAAVE
jgi:hypothetical protein